MRIHDPATYLKYTVLTPPIVARHGGRFLTRGDEVSTHEGETFTERMVIIEFPDRASAEAWYNDPDYQKASELRRAASRGRMILQESRGDTAAPDPKV
jgi:uncharacterized protein (DUF1330 family)